MATYTPKLGLKKPSGTDYVLVGDLNGNMDRLEDIIGDPTSLNSTDKTSLVSAINEAILRGGENAPYIDALTGTWWMWDFRTFQYVDTGVNAQGPAAEIVGATAEIDNTQGNPQVVVTMGGTSMARTFHFDFSGLRGVDGNGAVGSVNGALPNGEGDVTLIKTMTLELPAANWLDNQQLVPVEGAIEDGAKQHVITGLTNESVNVANSGTISILEQQKGALLFGCKYVPDGDITMNIMLIGGF